MAEKVMPTGSQPVGSREGERERVSTYYFTLSDVDSQEFLPRGFKYNPALISAIKARIDVSHRIWSPEDRLWFFHQSIISTADKLIHRYTATDALTGLSWSDSWCVLHLRQGAPTEVIHAAADALLSATDDPARRHRIETSKRICEEW